MKINDETFGTLLLDTYWTKKIVMNILGREAEIEIIVQTFDKKDITDIQRQSWLTFLREKDTYEKEIPKKLLSYYITNYEEISKNNQIPEKINKDNISLELIIKLIKIQSIIFNQDGSYGYLCDCAWEQEHGLAIKLDHGNIIIDQQDMLI